MERVGKRCGIAIFQVGKLGKAVYGSADGIHSVLGSLVIVKEQLLINEEGRGVQ